MQFKITECKRTMKNAISFSEKEQRLKLRIEAALLESGLSKATSKLASMSAKLVLVHKELAEIGDYIGAEDLRVTFICKNVPKISMGTFYKYLRWLEDMGMVQRQRQGNKPDLFRVMMAPSQSLD